MTHIISLKEAGSAELGLVGGKARGLGELIEAGFRVPDGFVVTSSAPVEGIRDLIAESLNGSLGPLAYRSSAAAEDLAEASYAGQYETVLGVEGLEAGLRALAQVRASARSDSAAGYRARHHDDDDRIAVIVQTQVDARVSGVAFTRNPVTGTDEVVIEATPGLGEALMSGEVTPEGWTVTDSATRAPSTAEGVLTAGEALEIAQLARKVEDALHGPQDIEWAFGEEGLWLLQARPITALPIEPAERPPTYQRWERADAFFPEPVTQLGFSAWLPTHTKVTGESLQRYGVPTEGIDHAMYWGRVYDRLIPPGGAKKDTGGLPPAPILKVLMKVVPFFRSAVKTAKRAAADDLPLRMIEAWEGGGREDLRARTHELRAVDRSALSNEGLVDHIEALEAHIERAGRDHFDLAFGGFVLLGQLGMLMEELVGWKPSRVLDLVAGYGGASREEGIALATTAAAVADDPLATDAFEDTHSLLALDSPGAEAVRQFLEQHGHRALNLRMSVPTWAEDPAPVLSLLRHAPAVTDDDALRVEAARVEAEAMETIPDPADRHRFKEAVDRARRGRPYGDETERDPLECAGIMRYIAVEAGKRLEAMEAIGHRDDVEFLTLTELKKALSGTRPDTGTIERRKGELRWALANPSPRVVGPDTGPPPGPHVFPAKARASVGAFLWAMSHLFDTPTIEHDEAGGLRGLGASAGSVTGIARVVRTPAEFDRIRPGDIVVCPSTMASWSPIFPIIGGLVTEVGGPLSHPGTLAREYGLPAVLSVADATTLIGDGDEITVDGAAGTVVITGR